MLKDSISKERLKIYFQTPEKFSIHNQPEQARRATNLIYPLPLENSNDGQNRLEPPGEN